MNERKGKKRSSWKEGCLKGLFERLFAIFQKQRHKAKSTSSSMY